MTIVPKPVEQPPGQGAIGVVVERYRRAALDDLSFMHELKRLGFSTTDALRYVTLIRSTLSDHNFELPGLGAMGGVAIDDIELSFLERRLQEMQQRALDSPTMASVYRQLAAEYQRKIDVLAGHGTRVPR